MTKVSEVTRADTLRLAAESGIDVRTIKRAVDRGISALRAEVDRDRLRAAAKVLGLHLKE